MNARISIYSVRRRYTNTSDNHNKKANMLKIKAIFSLLESSI